MKRFLFCFSGALFLLAASAASAAGGIAGYEPSSGASDGKAPTVFTCKKRSGGVVLMAENLILVRLEREGALPTGARADKNESGAKVSVLRYEDNPEAFRGTVYAIPLGNNWPAKGPNIEGIDVGRAIGSAQVGGANKISIDVAIPQGADWQPLNLVFVGPGSFGRAWVGVVGEGYQARNKTNAPLLLVGKACEQPTPEVIAAMASRP